MNCKNSILDESFAPSATVLPQVTLQLREVLARMDAQDELITDLKAEIAALKAEKATSTPPVKTATEEVESPQQVPPVPDPAISEEIIQLRADMAELNDLRASEIAHDRRRIGALEVPEVPSPTIGTMGHLDRLDTKMRESGIKQVSFATAAGMLGLSSSRLRQLKPLILEDRRFTIVKDPHHSQRLLIRTNFGR